MVSEISVLVFMKTEKVEIQKPESGFRNFSFMRTEKVEILNVVSGISVS